ncbi:MutS-related protein [Mucilaginibacter sp.]|jgi:DNA mismatch repair ATPase MutS|uniref:MutS-related protein n=1 Tax=Mucilaginibacter sp. TaxID=1882438 RepID=UPI002C54604E|nr:DNA mismatch repair protein MutS [Mucilaginibacter sp.]HTI60887.1 hypothetical protein [Mucilaginibacter sp.]
MDNPMIQQYRQNIILAQEQVKLYEEKINFYSVMRLVAFAMVLLTIYFSVKYESLGMFFICFIVLAIVFNWLVSKQAWFTSRKEYYQHFEKINENEINSILNYTNVYDNGAVYNNEKHYYTSDLDIFGDGSLFNLVNRAATPQGRDKLASWLIAPSTKDIIPERQEAIKEIGQKNEWKLDMQARLFFANKSENGELKSFFTYLNTPLELPGEKWLSKYIIIGSALFFILLIVAIFYPELKYGAIGMALINYFISSYRHEYTSKTDLIAGKIGDTLKRYSAVFNSIEGIQWQSSLNASLAATMKQQGDKSTSAAIKRLSVLINNLNARLNMMLGFILNAVFVWDIRFVIAIENWKRANHHNIEEAFGVVAEYEALISLASLHVNYPEWCFAEIADGEHYTLTAQNIAHPLISKDTRVPNDYELKDSLKIDIITGSNMAGKSTFLRTMGINSVLALCGAPVCADAMEVSVITVITYMRIKDSLNESTSTFKAELDRLQMLLAAVETQPKVFFLIDEMLRGTNSVDKYLGSKAVIKQLISKKGVGMVATHDLQIAQLETEYPGYVRNFYFDIRIESGEMLFDYKLKHGECKTFNASMLLKRIGIDIDAD